MDRKKDFTPNTLVVWDKEYTHFQSIEDSAKKSGDGPFIVTKIEDVNPAGQESAGHHQFVSIDIKGKIKKFSGAYLVRY
ncbi:MAG: hypothetical protein WCW78_00295 [Candidatus Paceibacterota bacterium]|jgi:hypothetical protein